LGAKERESQHQVGRELMARGDYAQAVTTLESALSAFGPHVGLISDLAGSAYLQGDMGKFAQFVERLEAEFTGSRALLSEKSRILTHVTCAKFFEEMGRIADAFREIDLALALIPEGDLLAFHVRCQKLRILASFGRESETAALYQACLTVTEGAPQLKIECFHALLIAEARLFGVKQAWPRLDAIAKAAELQNADLRLCAVDLLEIALETETIDVQIRLLEFIDHLRLSKFDRYEHTLLRLARREQLSLDDIFAWTRTLAPMGVMRLYALCLKLNPPEDVRDGVRRRLLFQIQSYDQHTRKLLSTKWAALLAERRLLELDTQRGLVRSGTAAISLATGRASLALTKALAHGLTDTLELQTCLELHDQENLRIQILRLNKRLSEKFGVDWLFKYRKSVIAMNPDIDWIVR